MTDSISDKAAAFAALHRPGQPLILFNAWDPGSAKIVAEAGAKAIATGSWSVAAAFGFADGEALPLALALDNARRIAASVALPVTIDLEAGYGDAAASAAAMAEAGAVGCNLEDGIVGQEGLVPMREQARRLAAVRRAVGGAFFVNARTDLFLNAPVPAHRERIDEAIDRACAYADAGASGLFVPGLVDEALIERVCKASPLPVNVMALAAAPDAKRLAALGVARISHGPGPYRLAMRALAAAAADAFA